MDQFNDEKGENKIIRDDYSFEMNERGKIDSVISAVAILASEKCFHLLYSSGRKMMFVADKWRRLLPIFGLQAVLKIFISSQANKAPK